MMKALNPDRVTPGHSATGTVKNFRRRQTVLLFAASWLWKGKSLAEIKKDSRMPEYAHWGSHPPLPTRLMAGLAILKHTYNLSDEALCARWIENPYYQLFCGEEFFRHDLPFDRTSITPIFYTKLGVSAWARKRSSR